MPSPLSRRASVFILFKLVPVLRISSNSAWAGTGSPPGEAHVDRPVLDYMHMVLNGIALRKLKGIAANTQLSKCTLENASTSFLPPIP